MGLFGRSTSKLPPTAKKIEPPPFDDGVWRRQLKAAGHRATVKRSKLLTTIDNARRDAAATLRDESSSSNYPALKISPAVVAQRKVAALDGLAAAASALVTLTPLLSSSTSLFQLSQAAQGHISTILAAADPPALVHECPQLAGMLSAHFSPREVGNFRATVEPDRAVLDGRSILDPSSAEIRAALESVARDFGTPWPTYAGASSLPPNPLSAGPVARAAPPPTAIAHVTGGHPPSGERAVGNASRPGVPVSQRSAGVAGAARRPGAVAGPGAAAGAGAVAAAGASARAGAVGTVGAAGSAGAPPAVIASGDERRYGAYGSNPAHDTQHVRASMAPQVRVPPDDLRAISQSAHGGGNPVDRFPAPAAPTQHNRGAEMRPTTHEPGWNRVTSGVPSGAAYMQSPIQTSTQHDRYPVQEKPRLDMAAAPGMPSSAGPGPGAGSHEIGPHVGGTAAAHLLSVTGERMLGEAQHTPLHGSPVTPEAGPPRDPNASGWSRGDVDVSPTPGFGFNPASTPPVSQPGHAGHPDTSPHIPARYDAPGVVSGVDGGGAGAFESALTSSEAKGGDAPAATARAAVQVPGAVGRPAQVAPGAPTVQMQPARASPERYSTGQSASTAARKDDYAWDDDELLLRRYRELMST